ncbi:hypothetical protein NDU88_007978 [Pleurodeles waltl]|uniref:Uncharacterized protein n=1 Tax=Pleurodeles waltl TaxID=8319 RepID=A0AAV7QTC9_PLEWA|nr:hypothetical protein NDU88_007978 [Pleurodeles waltl]
MQPKLDQAPFPPPHIAECEPPHRASSDPVIGSAVSPPISLLPGSRVATDDPPWALGDTLVANNKSGRRTRGTQLLRFYIKVYFQSDPDPPVVLANRFTPEFPEPLPCCQETAGFFPTMEPFYA